MWDRGTYECLKWEPRKVEVALHGGRVKARYALFPIDREDPPKDWMIHRMDPPEDPDREPMPRHLVPMLARAGALPADDGPWAYEIKWDGVRALAYSEPGELRLESRNLNDITAQYPELARLGRALGSHAAVLDGEIVAFDARGRPSFAALQRRMHVTSKSQIRRLAESSPVTYMIFDLLWLDGHSLMELPYEQRRERLAALGLDGEHWQTPEPLRGKGRDVLEATAEQGLEGVVAKRLDSPYRPGQRTGAWLKIKNVGRQEFVVGGWLPGAGRRKDRIGALLLGVHDAGGQLRYVGRVGSGFSERELDRLAELLLPLERQARRSPPAAAPAARGRLLRAAARRRGPVQRVDQRRQPAPPRLQGPARGQAARAGRARGRPRRGAAGDAAAGALADEALPELGAAAEQATVVVSGRELRLSNLTRSSIPTPASPSAS